MLFALRGSLSGYRVSHHAARRMEERGFDREDLQVIVERGLAFSAKRMLLGFYVPDSPFAPFLGDAALNRITGSVLILDPWREIVVTVYRNSSLEPWRFARWSA